MQMQASASNPQHSLTHQQTPGKIQEDITNQSLTQRDGSSLQTTLGVNIPGQTSSHIKILQLSLIHI